MINDNICKYVKQKLLKDKKYVIILDNNYKSRYSTFFLLNDKKCNHYL